VRATGIACSGWRAPRGGRCSPGRTSKGLPVKEERLGRFLPELALDECHSKSPFKRGERAPCLCVERRYEKIVGTVLTVLGVAILLVGFSQAYALYQNLPQNGSSSTALTSSFTWTANGFSVTFTDDSHPGASATISSSYWDFGDGNTTYANSTSHVYTKSGIFNVTLAVQDTSGAAAVSSGLVHVGPGLITSGQSSPSTSTSTILGGLFSGLNLGSSLTNMEKVGEIFIVVFLEWMIGGSILKAGWNLITPKAETIQVRVKPRSLQVEPVEPPASQAPPPLSFPAGSNAPSGTPPTAPPPSTGR